MDLDTPPDGWDPRVTLELAKKYLQSATAEGASFQEVSSGLLFFEGAAQVLLKYGGDEYSSRDAIYNVLEVNPRQIQDLKAGISTDLADATWDELDKKGVKPGQFLEGFRNLDSAAEQGGLADEIRQTESYQILQNIAEQIQVFYSDKYLQKTGIALVKMYSTELNVGTGDSVAPRSFEKAAKDINKFDKYLAKYMKFSGLSREKALKNIPATEEEIATLRADINMKLATEVLEEMHNNNTDPARQSELKAELDQHIKNSGLTTEEAHKTLVTDDQNIENLMQQAGQVPVETASALTSSPQEFSI